MSSNHFIKEYDETVLEIDESYEDALNRLMQLRGILREQDSNDFILEFMCDKKGRIMVSRRDADSRRYNRMISDRAYYIEGQLFCENGKTKLRFWSVYNKINQVSKYIANIVSVITFIVMVIFVFFSGNPFSPVNFILLVVVGIFCFASFAVESNESQNSAEDLKIMRDAIVDRIQAIEHWEE